MLLNVFTEFFKIGCVSIGGGYTVIPFLYYLAPKFNWFNVNEITNMIAVSNLTPGPIGINMATFAGYKAGGLLSSAVGTIAMVLPSIILVTIVSKLLKKYRDNCYIDYIMYGLRPAAVALISVAAWQILKNSILNIDKFHQTHNIIDILSLKALLMLIVFSILGYLLRKQPMYLILIAIIIGIVFKM